MHSALKTRVNALMAPGSPLPRGRTEIAAIQSIRTGHGSVPTPGRVGVPVLLVVVGEIVRLLLADHAQRHDPVQKLAADIAGLPHPFGSGLLNKLVEARLLDASMHVFRPRKIGHRVAL